MATSKKAATKPAAKKPGTSVIKWDEELAKQAEAAAGMENSTASGQFFSLKGGILSFNDAPVPGNQMGVIILDGILENVFYENAYDPEDPSGPTCFAFGRDEKALEPHKDVVAAGNAIHSHCAGCPMNEWGSADKGRGKACRNTRRLAMIPAGTFNQDGKFVLTKDPEHYESAAVAFMKLPVTSVKGYAAFVKQVAGALKRPPHAIVTKVSIRPDPTTQFKVVFEPIVQAPDEILGVLMKRHEEAKSLIDFPYQLDSGEDGEKPARKPAKSKANPAREAAKAALASRGKAGAKAGAAKAGRRY